MGHFLTDKARQITLAPGLSSIIEAAEAAGWSVKRGDSSVELVKPANRAETQVGYAINSKWWCKPLGDRACKSFRVTASSLVQLLDLPR
jgi:hypothetical protein